MNNYHSIVNLLKNSDAFMPGNQWGAHDLKNAGIKGIPVKNSALSQHLMIVKRKGVMLSDAAERFRVSVVEYYVSI